LTIHQPGLIIQTTAGSPATTIEETVVMKSPKEVSSFVARRVLVGRVRPNAYYYYYAQYEAIPYRLPTREQLANAFLSDAEFRALGLANWLNTPTGEVVATIVAEVIPATLEPEFSLIVDALKLAADLQQAKGRTQIGVGGFVALVLGIAIREANKAPA
jgi:hypothetical protein